MRRQLLLTAGFLLLSVFAYAGSSGRRAAHNRAAQLFGSSTPLVLAETGGSEEPAFYVFNADRKERGFAIVSAEGSLLGYAEHGVFNADSLPSQLVYWLQCYEEQVAMVNSGRAEQHRAAVIHDEIAPLVRTRWDQDAPYNALTPTFTYEGRTYQCATGCVATAMAQLLRYWAAPFETTEIPSYLCRTLNKTMPALPARTFNYDILQDSYASNASGASSEEVALLMLYCGQAAEMNYYQSSTASASGHYFAKYFGFNPNYVEADRSAFSSAAWDELIYSELKAGRPVLYSGSKVSNSGHAFLVDGYRDGLYHINWGWSGRYDGYFKLSEANPHGGGTGAGSGIGGYSFSQRAITRIQPEAMAADAQAHGMTVSQIAVSNTQVTRSSTSSNFGLSVTHSIWNYSGETQRYQLGLGIYQDGTLKYVKDIIVGTAVELAHNTGYRSLTVMVELGSGISSGQYELKAVYKPADSDTWVEDIGSDVYRIGLSIDGNTLTATNPTLGQLVVNSVEFSGSMKAGRELTAKVNLTNLGDEHASSVYLFLGNNLVAGSGVYIDKDETDDVELQFTPAASGTQTVRICCAANGSQPLWSGSIDVDVRRDPSIMVNNSTLANTSGSNILGTTWQQTLSVRNNDTESFDDEVIFRLYRLIEGTNRGAMVAEKRIDAVIPAGESRDVTVVFDGLETGSAYFTSVYVLKFSENVLLHLKQTPVYRITEAPSGIVSPMSDKVQSSIIYDLQGRRVTDTSKKGVYIVNGRKVVVADNR